MKRIENGINTLIPKFFFCSSAASEHTVAVRDTGEAENIFIVCIFFMGPAIDFSLINLYRLFSL